MPKGIILHADEVFELAEIEEQVVVTHAEVLGDCSQCLVLVLPFCILIQLIDLGIMLHEHLIEVFLDRKNPRLLFLLFKLHLLKPHLVAYISDHHYELGLSIDLDLVFM